MRPCLVQSQNEHPPARSYIHPQAQPLASMLQVDRDPGVSPAKLYILFDDQTWDALVDLSTHRRSSSAPIPHSRNRAYQLDTDDLGHLQDRAPSGDHPRVRSRQWIIHYAACTEQYKLTIRPQRWAFHQP